MDAQTLLIDICDFNMVKVSVIAIMHLSVDWLVFEVKSNFSYTPYIGLGLAFLLKSNW